MTSITTGLPGPHWDQHLIQLGGHLYQSQSWAQFQHMQGRSVLHAIGDDWSWMAALRRTRGGLSYLYAPYGPTVQAGHLADAVNSLISGGRTAGADFIRFEPLGPGAADTSATVATLHHLGGRLVSDMQPRYRLVLDITPDEATLRTAISSSNRNLINTAPARGLKLRISSDPADLSEFLAMQRQTAARQRITMHPDTYYHQLAKTLLPTGTAHLYFADHEDGPVASAICIDFAGTRYYVYAATYPELNRELKAAVALLWWMILDAKTHGLSTFDYGGVAPADQPDHPWAGHTRFKKSIGGQTISSAGTWEIPLNAAKYHLYRLARKVLPA
jgi:hypothetical protein